MSVHSLSYDPVPSVSPSGVPDVRARAQAGPEAFGAGIGQATAGLGQALQHAGAQVFDTAKFYSQVAKDDALNQLTEAGTKIGWGDPDNPVVGADGSQSPDLGFFGLKGAAALSGRKSAEDRLKDAVEKIKSGLDPLAQHSFDGDARRYLMFLSEKFAAHANGQAKPYYSSVYKAQEATSINSLANAPADEATVNLATNKLIEARVRMAQLEGDSPEAINAAVESAKAKALETRVLTISATDPVAAKKLLDENREMAGAKFQPLSDHLRTRADQQQGIGAANDVFKKTRQGTGYADPRLPIFTQAANSAPGSMSASGLARLVKIESSGNPNAGAGRSHQGLVQASEKWWSQFGQGSRLDPEEAIKAAARATAHDRPILASGLGHDPTDAELYLAHQQGPGGALALLRHPDLPAADALVAGGAYKSRASAAAAIAGNGGDPNKPASVFTSMWTAKFGGGTMPEVTPFGGQPLRLPESMTGAEGVAPETGIKPSLEHPTLDPAAEQVPLTMTKADAYREIMERTDLSDQAKSYAISHFNQIYSAHQIADAADEKARHQIKEQAATEYIKAFHNGVTPDMINQLYNDPRMDNDWHAIHSLAAIAEASPGSDRSSSFGPGWADLYNRIVLPYGDPNKIVDTMELVRAAGPGGSITKAGFLDLKTALDESLKSSTGEGFHSTKAGMIAYAKNRLVIDDVLSGSGRAWIDQEGVRIFNGEFIPKFNAALSKWIEDKNDPFKFLTKEHMDELWKPLRSAADIAKAQIEAGLIAGENPAVQRLPPPPAPTGVDEKKWDDVIIGAPHRFTRKMWGDAVVKLVADPSKEAVREFDEYFGPLKAQKAQAILDSLGVEAGK